MGVMPRRKLIRMLEADGFVYDSSDGGHDYYMKDTRKVPVPHHGKGIADPLLSKILSEAGLKHRR